MSFIISPRGAFSLAETAGFAFIDRDSGPPVNELRLAFCRDADLMPTAVHLTQDYTNADVTVHGQDTDRDQVERILGLDVDATSFREVGDRDPVVRTLQDSAPGLRPPVLPSAYEAAAWCILQARRPGTQARQMRNDLAKQAGTVLTVAGVDLPCLPPPETLVKASAVKGLDQLRLDRLHGIARAARDGQLDTHQLRSMDYEDARRHVERLPGIGPFSSAIIVGRSLGHPDALFGPLTELNERVGELYQLGHPASPPELSDVAATWAPWRAWTQVYFRAVAPRLTRAGSGGPVGTSSTHAAPR